MASRVRLNFVITEQTDQNLHTYCDLMGRTSSDVVRQLVVEWLEGDRSLPEPCRAHPEGRRTNLQLTTRAREALEARVAKDGHITISAAIEALLSRFLANRVPFGSDVVTVRLKLPLPTYKKTTAAAQLCGETIEGFIGSTLDARLENMVSALQEEA
jgi:hypothetical protein